MRVVWALIVLYVWIVSNMAGLHLRGRGSPPGPPGSHVTITGVIILGWILIPLMGGFCRVSAPVVPVLQTKEVRQPLFL